jgi:hypothetical protein
MITAIIGKPGAGKTALMTARAINNMFGDVARDDIKNCKANLKGTNGGYGAGLVLPRDKRHLVYADYKIEKKVYGGRDLVRHPCNGYYLALPTPIDQQPENYVKPMLIPPYSHIYLDEAQRYFDSDIWNRLSQDVKLFYEMHRHNHLDVTYTCQRDTRIAASIRQLVGEVIDIQSVKVKRGWRKVYTVWEYLTFSSTEAHEAYTKSSVKTRKRDLTTFKIEGNVFRWFSSYERQDLFYKDLDGYAGFDFDAKDGIRPGFFKQIQADRKEDKA